MQAAVLTIGSLFWDERPLRTEWRKRRLRVDGSRPVKARIHYGRYSHSRGGTYTMTFAVDAPEGSARLVPCVAPIESIDDLVEEARELWAAEAWCSKPGKLGTDWGCCGVLFRESSSPLADAWARSFRQHGPGPIPPVGANGDLRIPWPVGVDGERVEVDLILAAVTEAEPRAPTPETIATAWARQSEGHQAYFFENVRCGIRTHQDHEVWREILVKCPRWLDEPKCAEAVGLLRETLEVGS